MPATFLFVIPLTPPELVSPERLTLRKICMRNLISQNYDGWKALLIGKLTKDEVHDDRFILLDFDGHKEEKMQKATEYIIRHEVAADYIIRLDDDDVFNPQILNRLKEKSFDLCVDKYQSFWNSATGEVAQKIMYWFPNTCIHKREIALAKFGKFPPGEYKRYKDYVLLIENEHNDFHLAYSQKNKIIFTSRQSPVYLRTMNQGSITAQQSEHYQKYLGNYGYWTKNKFGDFKFLNDLVQTHSETKTQGFKDYLRVLLANLRAGKNYKKIVINKHISPADRS